MIILEPKKLEERIIKRQQKNKQLLMKTEVLNIKTLFINESWDFDLNSKYIKCKKIIGNIILNLNYIPGWIKDIEIDGYFACDNCSLCNLTSLKNCPKKISQSFYCDYNNLTSLEDGPTFVGGNYYCKNNSARFSEKYVRSICDVKYGIII